MTPKQNENLSGTLNTPDTTIIGNTPTHTKNTSKERIKKTGKCQTCGTTIDPKYDICYKCLQNRRKHKTTHTQKKQIENIGKCQTCGTTIDPKYHLCYKCLQDSLKNKTEPKEPETTLQEEREKYQTWKNQQ